MDDRPGLLGQVAPEEPSDACCWACSGGGDVACCDGCRAVYHLSCIGLEQLPEDDWFCPLCCCRECRTACRGQEDPAFINTKLLPVLPKQLPQPRAGPHQRYPAGPGYLCPQQARLWLQPPPEEQPQQQDATGSAAQAAAAAAAAAGSKPAGDAAEEPSAKRQKQEPRSSSGSVSPTGGAVAAAAFVRCCCCQAACHVNCLLPPLKQQYVGRPPLAGLVPQPPPQPAAPQANGTPGKRSTPRRQQQQGKASPSAQKQQQLPSLAAAAAGSPPAPVDPYFCSLACQQAANQLASRCAQGMVQVDALADGTPVAFQVVQPAAVAAALAGSGAGAGTAAAARQPQAAVGLLGTGVAAGHSVAQAVVLARVVQDATQLLARELGPAWEVRSLDDTLPWLVGGLRQAVPGGMLDLSHIHLGLLWVGGTLAGAAVLRLHGPNLLEVPLAATQRELHHKQLGKLLLGCIERLAFDTCKVRQAWLPALNDVARPCTGVSLLPTAEQQQQPGQRQQLVLDPGCSVKLLGLDSAAAAAAAAAEAGGGSGGSRARQRQHAQQQSQARRKSAGDAQTCWGHQLGYGPAQTVADWMQLPRHMLLRCSFVPFLTKRLGPDSLVPLPKFSSRPLAAAVAPAAAADASGAAVAAAAEGGAAASSGWQSEAALREARRLVADAFPTPADIPGYQLQPVRRTKRQAKRRKWEDAVELPLDEEDEDMMLMQQPAEELTAVEASDDAGKDPGAEGQEQQQQRQQQRSKRQEFQEQVRQQFLARQQALSKPRREQQRQGKQDAAGGTADAAPTQEMAAADQGAAVPAAAQALSGGGAAADAAAAVAAADAQAVAAAAEPGGPAEAAPAAAVAGEGTPA